MRHLYATDVQSKSHVEQFNKLNYLTEKSLSGYLSELYRGNEFIHDKCVKGSGLKNRPDYYSEKLSLIVEFDGPTHYTNTATILTDIKKDTAYEAIGIRVVRIPYFLQLDSYTINILFGIDNWSSETPIYPHGFIDRKAILPADFCGLGLLKYGDMAGFPHNTMSEANKGLAPKGLLKEYLTNIFPEWVIPRSCWYQHHILGKPIETIVPLNELGLWLEAVDYGFPT